MWVFTASLNRPFGPTRRRTSHIKSKNTHVDITFRNAIKPTPIAIQLSHEDQNPKPPPLLERSICKRKMSTALTNPNAGATATQV